MLWDLFARVIDNHGDAGVSWRLAAELAARGQQVRLWIDDASALRWMAPGGRAGVQCIPWTEPAPRLEPGDVVVEAFGCDPPGSFVEALARRTRTRGRQPPWLNLEYLSAQPYVERSHGLPSPVAHGAGAGLVKRFFYPGFTARTGGLLREQDLAQRQARFDAAAWLQARGLPAQGGRRISLFCYEPPRLDALLAHLANDPLPTILLVTAGRAAAAVRRLLPATQQAGQLHVHYLPLLSQRDYDHLLWSCDFNFVRGEDSWVRALWAGRPFAWQAYAQHDDAHHAKVRAWLDWLAPPPGLARFHLAWNGLEPQALPPLDPDGWASHAAQARQRALALPELVAGLQDQAARPATI